MMYTENQIVALTDVLFRADLEWCDDTGDEVCGREFHRFLAGRTLEAIRPNAARARIDAALAAINGWGGHDYWCHSRPPRSENCKGCHLETIRLALTGQEHANG